MTNTFVEFSDGLLSSSSIGMGATKELGETMKKFLALSEKASRDSLETLETPEAPNEQLLTDPIVENYEFPQNLSAKTIHTQNLSSMPFSFEINPILRHSGMQLTPTMNGTNATDTNPWGNYGLWGGLPQQGSYSDMHSYIIAGRDSFAARLFYETIVRGLRSLRGEGPAEDAYRMFRFKFAYKNPAQIRSLLDRVLNKLLHGTSQIPIRELEAENAQKVDELAIKSRIIRDIETMGGSEKEYLTSWDVEHFLKNKWRLSLDSNWVRVRRLAIVGAQDGNASTTDSGLYDKFELFAPTMIPGFSQPKPVFWDASSLVEKLEGLAVTIGQGPRWHYKDVDTAVETFLEENQGLAY